MEMNLNFTNLELCPFCLTIQFIKTIMKVCLKTKVVSGQGDVEGEGSRCSESILPRVPCPSRVLLSALNPSVRLP